MNKRHNNCLVKIFNSLLNSNMNLHNLLAMGLILNLYACSNGANRTQINNTTPITIGNGINGKNAFNVPFITLTICQSGTNNCQTVDHVLLDSGSTGFRINQSALTINNLTPITYANKQLYQCVQYSSGYTFGPEVLADIKISSEVASNIPIQILEDTSQVNVPITCSQNLPFGDLKLSGANAIIGINPLSNPDNTLASGGIYTCESNGNCTKENPNNIPIGLNVNPISAFPVDNNGAIISLPNVLTATDEILVGRLTFGLNTQNNNQVPDQINTILGSPANADKVAPFTSLSSGSTESSKALIDSGTPVLSFPSNQMPLCQDPLPQFYCPTPSPQDWGSTVSGYNGSNQLQLSLPIINYSTDVAAIHKKAVPDAGITALKIYPYNVYGLPFFFGRSIYLGFKGTNPNGQQTPLGTGPAWGYTN